ncbi:MAG: hypothetical protein LBR16_00560 [Treponema sp.]|jgi:FtsZ-binding cell division protein ZapB|nr:hypothetical protein [Treponema sp.]
MITLEQVKQLETKVTRAIDLVRELSEENTLLHERTEAGRAQITALERQISVLEEQVQLFRGEQKRIEEGILATLDRLNKFEDVVERRIHAAGAASYAASAPAPAPAPEPASAPAPASEPEPAPEAESEAEDLKALLADDDGFGGAGADGFSGADDSAGPHALDPPPPLDEPLSLDSLDSGVGADGVGAGADDFTEDEDGADEDDGDGGDENEALDIF